MQILIQNRDFIKIVLSGIVGGLVLTVTMYILFGVIGFGLNFDGILLNPNFQSEKLIAVWTEIEPIPLAFSNPFLFSIGLIIFGIFHAFIYEWLSPVWPSGVKEKAFCLALLIFFLSYLFFEFFTPFNMFSEPIPLIGLELTFWAIIALSEAFTIALIRGWKPS
jgi:hypothetical protein